jgi:hypothetical protein
MRCTVTGTGGSGSLETALEILPATNYTVTVGAGGARGNFMGGNGGSGTVILRYADTFTITIGAGLTGSESAAAGGYKRATFTAGTGNVSIA